MDYVKTKLIAFRNYVEKKLTAFRDFFCMKNSLLRGIILVTHTINTGALTKLFAAEYGTESWWRTSAIKWNLVAWFYLALNLSYSAFYTRLNNSTIARAVAECPILLGMKKEVGKVFALCMFTIMDGTLKKKNGVWIVTFCTSFFLHLLHIMVFYGVKEDYDFAGGFIAASFALLYEMCRTWWDVIFLVIITAFMASYKSLMIGGVEALGLG